MSSGGISDESVEFFETLYRNHPNIFRENIFEFCGTNFLILAVIIVCVSVVACSMCLFLFEVINDPTIDGACSSNVSSEVAGWSVKYV